jgi:hypothetical protein
MDPEHVSQVLLSFFFFSSLTPFLYQVMIAEQAGLLRLVSWKSQTPFITLNAGLKPLSSAQWNPSDRMKFGAVADRKWLLWNLTPGGVRVSFPVVTGDAHTDGSKLFCWSLFDSDVFAITSTRNMLKVCDAQKSHVPRPYPQRNRIADFSWQAGSSSWIVVTADCFLKFISL